MSKSFEWVLIKKFKPEPIGAIGFIDNKAVAVVAFFDDLDGNKDGKVSLGERVAGVISPVSLEGVAIAEVARQASVDMNVLQRDAGFAQVGTQIFLNFARGLVLDGIYTVYFSRGVKMAGAGMAKTVTSNAIKSLVIRKGFEKSAREAFNSSTAR